MKLAFFLFKLFSLLLTTAALDLLQSTTKKPWLVRVETIYHTGHVSTCMGAIISERWVMMAPQCASRDGLYTSFKTAVGIHTKPEGWGPQGYSINLRTPLFYREHYEANGNNYTIAFAKLSGYQIQTTRNVVEPVKILNEHCDQEGIANVCQGAFYVMTVDEEMKRLSKHNPSECGLGNGELRKWCLGGANEPVNSTQIMHASPVFCKLNVGEDVAVGIIHEAAGVNRVSMFKLCDVTKWIEAQIDYDVGIRVLETSTGTSLTKTTSTSTPLTTKETEEPMVTFEWNINTVEWETSYEPAVTTSPTNSLFTEEGLFTTAEWMEETAEFTSTQPSISTEIQQTTQSKCISKRFKSLSNK